jgi:hypothetical protein
LADRVGLLLGQRIGRTIADDMNGHGARLRPEPVRCWPADVRATPGWPNTIKSGVPLSQQLGPTLNSC